MADEDIRLDELSEEEFRDVELILDPARTDAEIERDWLEFCELKRVARANGSAMLWQ